MPSRPIQALLQQYLSKNTRGFTCNWKLLKTDELLSIKAKMEDLVKDFPHLIACDLESVVLVDSEETATEFILPKFPSIFYIAYLTGMVDDTNFCQLITQMFRPLHVEMVVLLIQRVLGYLMKRMAPFSKCSSHLLSGTMWRLCTSVYHSQQDAVSLYKNLRALPKHFAHSAKSMEILNEACNIFNRNSVHILNWRCTGIAGFLDACVIFS